MNEEELRCKLETRERQMHTFQGEEGIMTDQWRIYAEAARCLEEGEQAAKEKGMTMSFLFLLVIAILYCYSLQYM